MIEAKGLSIGYAKGKRRRVVAEGIDFMIPSASLTCITGNNGSGKSTLLKTIAGELPALGGTVEIQRRAVSDYSLKELSKTIGIVAATRIQAPNITAGEVVRTGRMPYTGFWDKGDETDKKIVEESMLTTGIDSLKDRKVETLSDGEMQKVMIAKTLAQQTDIVLLDEPTAFLDPKSKVALMQLLSSLAHEQGKTIIMTTHDLQLAERYADIILQTNDETTEKKQGITELSKEAMQSLINSLFIAKIILIATLLLISSAISANTSSVILEETSAPASAETNDSLAIQPDEITLALISKEASVSERNEPEAHTSQISPFRLSEGRESSLSLPSVRKVERSSNLKSQLAALPHFGASIDLNGGVVLKHSKYVKSWLRSQGMWTVAAEARYFTMPSDDDAFAEDYNFPEFYGGLRFGNYNNVTMHKEPGELWREEVCVDYTSKMGSMFTVYAGFSRPWLRRNRWEFDYTLSAGAGYCTHPYNADDNQDNELIGSRWSIYFGLGLHARYRIGKSMAVRAGLDFMHHSNGCFARPNMGSNAITPSIGLIYYPAMEERQNQIEEYNRQKKEAKALANASSEKSGSDKCGSEKSNSEKSSSEKLCSEKFSLEQSESKKSGSENFSLEKSSPDSYDSDKTADFNGYYHKRQPFHRYFYLQFTAGYTRRTLNEEWLYNRSDMRHYPNYSFSAALMYRYQRRWASGISIDLDYGDYAWRVNQLETQTAPDYDAKPVSVGFSARHEVFYGNLSLAMQIGTYFYRHIGNNASIVDSKVFEKIGIHYHIRPLAGLTVGINVKAHTNRADYTEFIVAMPIKFK